MADESFPGYLHVATGYIRSPNFLATDFINQTRINTYNPKSNDTELDYYGLKRPPYYFPYVILKINKESNTTEVVQKITYQGKQVWPLQPRYRQERPDYFRLLRHSGVYWDLDTDVYRYFSNDLSRTIKNGVEFFCNSLELPKPVDLNKYDNKKSIPISGSWFNVSKGDKNMVINNHGDMLMFVNHNTLLESGVLPFKIKTTSDIIKEIKRNPDDIYYQLVVYSDHSMELSEKDVNDPKLESKPKYLIGKSKCKFINNVVRNGTFERPLRHVPKSNLRINYHQANLISIGSKYVSKERLYINYKNNSLWDVAAPEKNMFEIELPINAIVYTILDTKPNHNFYFRVNILTNNQTRILGSFSFAISNVPWKKRYL